MLARPLIVLAALGLCLMLGAGNALAGGWNWRALMSPDEVRMASGLPALTVLDIRSPKDFANGHIPGAVNLPYPGWRGPKENPGALIDDARLTTLLQGVGITPATPVVVTYAGKGTLGFGGAARVYWTLKSAGVTQIAVLNGGNSAWAAAGHPLSDAPAKRTPSEAQFALSDRWTIDRPGVEAVLAGEREAVMVDARPAKFFRGEAKHAAAAWAGTLAGALNITHESFFRKNAELIADPDEILRIAQAAGYRPGGPELVSFCNTGHWAATNWFALSEVAGIEGVRLYPESMVGWTRAVPKG